MKRLLLLFFFIGAVATVLNLPPVTPAAAAPPGCFCGGYQYTPQDWAQGDSCAEAQANLQAQANPYIDCEGYNTCARALILTAGCHWDVYSGKWQVDGYVRYRCWVCD